MAKWKCVKLTGACLVITEIKRKDKDGVAHPVKLKVGETIELSKEEERLLFNGEGGPLVPRGSLVEVKDAPVAPKPANGVPPQASKPAPGGNVEGEKEDKKEGKSEEKKQ